MLFAKSSFHQLQFPRFPRAITGWVLDQFQDVPEMALRGVLRHGELQTSDILFNLRYDETDVLFLSPVKPQHARKKRKPTLFQMKKQETLNVNFKAVVIPQSSIAALEIISQALLRHNTPPKRSKHSQLTVPEAARVKVAPCTARGS